MDTRVIVYPTRLRELYERLRIPSTRPFDDSYTLYEEIGLGFQTCDAVYEPQFLNFEAAQNQYGDYTLREHVGSWMNLAENAALAGHMLYLEDGPEIVDPEQEKDQDEVLVNMYAPGCTSADQARLTTEQAE
jgi:hypothetical protein